jgi:hypothetical protein
MTSYNLLTVDRLTAAYLIENYLWGVPLCDARGNPMPHAMIQTHINNAIGQFSKFTGINLTRRIIKSKPVDEGLVLGVDYHEVIGRLPYNEKLVRNFFQIQLPHSGIISVERVRGFLREQALAIDAESVRISHPIEGIIQIIPNTVMIGAFINYGIYPVPARAVPFMASLRCPAFWSVDYTVGPNAGLRDDGGLGPDMEAGAAYIDDDIGDWIFKTAAIVILNIASIAIKPGVASESFSFEGISRSLSTTASGVNPYYGSMIDQFRKDIANIDLKKYRKRGRGLRVYGA